MLHTKEGFRLIPGPRTPGHEPPLPLGAGGPSSQPPRGNETTARPETTAAIAEGQNAARGSPGIDKYEASLRTPLPLTPQAGVGAAAAPPARRRLPPPPPG